jgi:hypothetical protein
MTDGWAQKYLRKNEFAGPHEAALRRTLSHNWYDVGQARKAWRDAAEDLDELADLIKRQERQIRVAYDNGDDGTGARAADSYRRVREMLEARKQEMDTVAGAIEEADEAFSQAQTSYRNLPSVNAQEGNPDKPNRAEYEKAERQAEAALRKLEGSMAGSTDRIRPVAGMERPASGTTGSTTSGAHTPSGGVPTGGTPPPGGTGPGYPNPEGHEATDTGPVVDGPPEGWPPDGYSPDGGPPDWGDDGDLSGGDGSGLPESSPVSGGGMGLASGAAFGAGAAALGGAGAVAGTRGAGAVRAGLGKTVALGRSVTSAAKGTLGRSVVAAQGTSGRGTSGRGAGRGVVAGSGQGIGRAGSRGGRGMAAGAGSGTGSGKGKGAGKGKGGGKGAGSGKGGATGRRAPLSAAATGGRRGERDREESAEHVAFDDEQAWLGDEETGDAVID